MIWLLLCLLLIGFLDIKCHNTHKAVNKFHRSYILDLDIHCLKLVIFLKNIQILNMVSNAYNVELAISEALGMDYHDQCYVHFYIFHLRFRKGYFNCRGGRVDS